MASNLHRAAVVQELVHDGVLDELVQRHDETVVVCVKRGQHGFLAVLLLSRGQLGRRVLAVLLSGRRAGGGTVGLIAGWPQLQG